MSVHERRRVPLNGREVVARDEPVAIVRRAVLFMVLNRNAPDGVHRNIGNLKPVADSLLKGGDALNLFSRAQLNGNRIVREAKSPSRFSASK